jgi:hypothetical protein
LKDPPDLPTSFGILSVRDHAAGVIPVKSEELRVKNEVSVVI